MALLIFDLDGTLIDSKQDLVEAVNATRAVMDLPALDSKTIASYVGNGAPMLIKRAMPSDYTEEMLKQALESFLAYYHAHALVHTRLYPGVQEALETFRDRGEQLAVLTNKPVRISRVILDGLGIGQLFFRVYGGNSFEQKKPDPIGITSLMTEAGTSSNDSLMIGDSSVDIQTARNAGIRSIGVTYGFQPESFASIPPDYTVADMREIAGILYDSRTRH